MRTCEKIYHTLNNTKGFKAVRFELATCVWCALGKSTRAGLSHAKNAISIDPPSVMITIGDAQYQVALNANEDCTTTYDDSDDSDQDSDIQGWHGEVEYLAPTAGRDLGVQPVPRYDLSKLEPFEVMFADNKDYPCVVRGSKQIAFVLIDYDSQAKFKVDVSAKTENGDAFLKIVAMNGVHKLPYSCRIWTDGCGSMKHVENAAIQAGIDHAYTPPEEPSLNEAEKVCNFMWAAARAHMASSKGPHYLFA